MRTWYFPVLAAVVLILQSCTGDRSETVKKNDLLPDRMVVFTESKLGHTGDTSADVPGKLAAYNESVIRKALAGELTLHEPILSHRGLLGTAPLSPESLHANLGMTTGVSPATVDSIIRAFISEITSGLFIEEWVMDKDRFQFRKQVIAYQPVRHIPVYIDNPVTSLPEPTGDTTLFLLFSLMMDKSEEPALMKNGMDGLVLLAENIRYGIDLYNRPYYEYLYTDENLVSERDVEGWASYNFIFYKYFDRELFLDIILEKVTSGDIKAYNANDPSESLSRKDIYASVADTIWTPVRDTLTGNIRMELEEVNFPTENINSIIFIEDWYYSKAGMGIVKIVKGIIPVLHNAVYDNGSNLAGTEKIPIFLVWFNND
jgi:hypothetical protein